MFRTRESEATSVLTAGPKCCRHQRVHNVKYFNCQLMPDNTSSAIDGLFIEEKLNVRCTGRFVGFISVASPTAHMGDVWLLWVFHPDARHIGLISAVCHLWTMRRESIGMTSVATAAAAADADVCVSSVDDSGFARSANVIMLAARRQSQSRTWRR